MDYRIMEEDEFDKYWECVRDRFGAEDRVKDWLTFDFVMTALHGCEIYYKRTAGTTLVFQYDWGKEEYILQDVMELTMEDFIYMLG